MPTTRRSTGNTGPTKGQSTISFANRVTKSIPKDTTKKAVISDTPKKVDIPERPAKEPEVVEIEPEVEVEEPQEEKAVPEKTEAELKAEKVTDAQIKKYWKAIESERRAPRVHQQDLSQSEKILRYFDVSSQYGPCIGVERMKRWYRAERLGLNPPIEVLAVLKKEGANSNKNVETAQMDNILNATV